MPANTVLVRLAAVAALAVSVSGCGGDDPETASTPVAPVASSPAPVTTPEATTPTASTPDADAKAKDPAATTPEPTPAEAKAALAETKKVAEEASKGTSDKEMSNDELAQQMKRAYDGLKAAKITVAKPIVSGEQDNAALSVDNGNITVVFLRSPKKAAAAGAVAEKTFKESSQKIKIARKANRLFLLNLLPTEPTAKQVATFRQVRKIVNGAA